jgi:orotate phosphoribosyltransferase
MIVNLSFNMRDNGNKSLVIPNTIFPEERPMTPSKTAFIELALKHKALKFGQFTLKSGRTSPYFFNAGAFNSGTALQALGEFYAQILVNNHINFQHLFGPAYKGLPLATATAIALAKAGVDITVTFNRKESKDHGEGGLLMGAPLTGNTVIIDDVITAGTAFREAKQLIEAEGATVTAAIIALDRCEKGTHQQSTLQEIESQNIRVLSIITLFDLIDYLKTTGETQSLELIQAYQKEYGIH